MTRQYFGTDGIRGEVGQYPITPDFVMKLGWAAGTVLAREGNTKILIGKDTRISGYMLESALQAGIIAAGVDVRLLGPMPTPGIAYLTRTFRAAAGIVISASHNPHYDNGIKFFSDEGKKLCDETEHAIEAMLDKPMQTVSSERLGKARRIQGARERYIEFCKSTVSNEMRLTGLRIVIDSANGACYHIAPDLLEELGAEVISLADKPDGLNINAGCGSTQPQLLQAKVSEVRADVGIAVDGDGDRLIMVDHQGYLLDGDHLLYIMATHRLEQQRLRGGVVGTLMTNLGLELALKKMGVELVRANVGDRYVMAELEARRWHLGGESSGHLLCLDKTTTGDAMVSALQVLSVMVEKGCSLSDLAAGFTKFPQHMVNVPVAKRFDPLKNEQIQSAVQAMETRLAETGRVLLRASGTEPLIRVMVEGEDASFVEACAEELAEVVARVSSKN